MPAPKDPEKREEWVRKLRERQIEAWKDPNSKHGTEEVRKKYGNAQRGKPGVNLGRKFGPHTEEYKREASERNKGKLNFEGGDSGWWHVLAFDKFGENNCEICKEARKSNKVLSRLSMHCVSDDYKIMKRRNWITTCQSCHVLFLDAHKEIKDDVSGRLFINKSSLTQIGRSKYSLQVQYKILY
jgi:hypothetical protein